MPFFFIAAATAAAAVAAATLVAVAAVAAALAMTRCDLGLKGLDLEGLLEQGELRLRVVDGRRLVRVEDLAEGVADDLAGAAGVGDRLLDDELVSDELADEAEGARRDAHHLRGVDVVAGACQEQRAGVDVDAVDDLEHGLQRDVAAQSGRLDSGPLAPLRQGGGVRGASCNLFVKVGVYR